MGSVEHDLRMYEKESAEDDAITAFAEMKAEEILEYASLRDVGEKHLKGKQRVSYLKALEILEDFAYDCLVTQIEHDCKRGEYAYFDE